MKNLQLYSVLGHTEDYIENYTGVLKEKNCEILKSSFRTYWNQSQNSALLF
jgi:hypothetical protein